MPRHSNKKSNKTSSKINKNIRIKKKPAYPFGRAGFFLFEFRFGEFYSSINFLAALSWCLITLKNSWLS